MYESPVTKIVGDMICEMQKNEEGNFVCSISQSVGYDVDRDEMIKALNYDRNQYQKGYEDGLKADRWIPLTVENQPRPFEECLFTDNEGDVIKRGWDGSFSKFKAWMPVPDPYKGNEVNDD